MTLYYFHFSPSTHSNWFCPPSKYFLRSLITISLFKKMFNCLPSNFTSQHRHMLHSLRFPPISKAFLSHSPLLIQSSINPPGLKMSQSSVLKPLLFSIYTLSLVDVVLSLSVNTVLTLTPPKCQTLSSKCESQICLLNILTCKSQTLKLCY